MKAFWTDAEKKNEFYSWNEILSKPGVYTPINSYGTNGQELKVIIPERNQGFTEENWVIVINGDAGGRNMSVGIAEPTFFRSCSFIPFNGTVHIES